MSDMIETHGDRAAFASLREPGWHDLGTVFHEEVTVDELLGLAHLSGWNIRVEEMEAPEGYGMTKPYYFVVRDNPFVDQTDILHVSGKRYTPFQNESLFYMADGIGRWETAGSIKDGRVVFGSISIDREVVLDPNGVEDRIKNYLLVAQAHDGTMAITGANTPIRVVCNNTLTMALQGASQSFKFRHTETAEAKASMVAEALQKSHGYIDQFEIVANELLATSITDEVFWKIVNAAYPQPDAENKRGITAWEKRADQLVDLRTAETNAAFADTAWGAYNTLIEAIDWFRTGRGENAATNLAAARSGFDPVVNAEKNRLLQVVQAVA